MNYQREFTARSRVHMMECWLNSFMPPTRTTIVGCQMDDIVCIGQQGEWHAYFSQPDIERAGQIGLAFLSSAEAIQQHLASTQQAQRACLAACAPFQAQSVEAFDPKTLVAHINNIFATYTHLQAHYQISGTHFSTLATEQLSQRLTVPPSQRPSLLSILTTGDHGQLRTFQEKQAWLALLIEHKQQRLPDAAIQARLHQHSDTYAFVGFDALGADPHQFFQTRWQHDQQIPLETLLQQQATLQHSQQQRQQQRQAALAALSLTPDARQLTDGLAQIGVSRLQIRETFTLVAHRSYPLFQHVFQLYQQQVGPLEEDYLRQLSVAEVIQLAQGNTLPRHHVLERFSHGYLAVRQGHKQSLRGVLAKEKAAQLIDDAAAQQKPQRIKGVVGHTGAKVTGRAFVLKPGLSRGEQVRLCREEMQAGDILVAGMTYPSLVPACEMAGGILTDFGGVTCHAVIVAREFNIPCIVGTNWATHLVKTGDVIEMDTQQGVVHLVDQAQPIPTPHQPSHPIKVTAYWQGDRVNASTCYTLALKDYQEHHAPLVGGKAASLGRLYRLCQTDLDAFVPDGFCWTTAASEQLVGQRLRQAVPLASDQADLLLLADAIQAALPQATFSPRLMAEVKQGCAQLDMAQGVAVRSSGVEEDSEAVSFAGQHATCLGVRQVEAVLTAVRHCIASGYRYPTLRYRQRHGLTVIGQPMPVVVQQLVAARSAGVMLTCDPRDETSLWLEAVWGLGEPLVSGTVTPDSFQVKRANGRLAAAHIAPKTTAAVWQEQQVQMIPVAAEQQTEPALTTAEIAHLIHIGRSLEQAYGYPLEIEWAVADNGRIALLQARPLQIHTK